MNNLGPLETVDRQQVLRELAEKGLIFEKTELHSGVESDWYFDARKALSSGPMLQKVGTIANDLLRSEGIEFNAVGGPGIGAGPVTSAIILTSDNLDKYWFRILDEPETDDPYQRLIRGAALSWDNRVLLVDDTTTTGSSFRSSMEILSGTKCTVSAALSLLDRSDGATEAYFAEQGIPYHSLFNAEELLGSLAKN